MDDDGRGFDATLAFLAEFQEVAVPCSSPNGYSLPELATGCTPGHFHYGAMDAMSDSTASTELQKPTSKTSAGTKPKATRRPRAQKASSGDATASQSKASKKKTVAETSSILETKTHSTIAETVTMVKPLSKKDEIEFLKEQAVELEKTLDELKRSQRGGRGYSGQVFEAGRPVGGRDQQAQKPSKRIPSMWEELAISQSKQRQNAHVENMKLKTKLQDQLKLADSLQRMLKRSKNDESVLHKDSKSAG